MINQVKASGDNKIDFVDRQIKKNNLQKFENPIIMVRSSIENKLPEYLYGKNDLNDIRKEDKASEANSDFFIEIEKTIERLKPQVDGQDKAESEVLEDSLTKFIEGLDKINERTKENREEKLKEKLEQAKRLTNSEISKILATRPSELDFASIYRALHGQGLKSKDTFIEKLKSLPMDLKDQISNRIKENDLFLTKDHKEIGERLVLNGQDLSDKTIKQMDKLLRIRQVDLEEEEVSQIAKNFKKIEDVKIDDILLIESSRLANKDSLKTLDLIKSQPIEDLERLGLTERTSLGEAIEAYKSIEAGQSTKIEKKPLEGAELGLKEAYNQDEDLSGYRNQAKNLKYISYKMNYQVALSFSLKGIDVNKQLLADLCSQLTLAKDYPIGRLREQEGKIDQAIPLIQEVDQSFEFIKKTSLSNISLISQRSGLSLASVADISIRYPAKTYLDSYEALATGVRRDLGDSMNKAFEKVDRLLESLDIEASQENIRAAIILARGQDEISIEKLDKIKELDENLQILFKYMTPNLIRGKGLMEKDILNMPLEDLAKEVWDYAEKEEISDIKNRLARQIYEMRDDKEASNQYINFYKLVRTIEKSKGASLAFLNKNKMEINLENLYEAARYVKGNKLEAQIGDDIRGFKKNQEPSLKEKIRHASYRQEARANEILREAEKELNKKNTINSEKTRQLITALKDLDQADFKNLYIKLNNPSLAEALAYKDLKKDRFVLLKNLGQLKNMLKGDRLGLDLYEEIESLLEDDDILGTKEGLLEKIKELEEYSIEAGISKEILAKTQELRLAINMNDHLWNEKSYLQVPMLIDDKLRQLNVYFKEEIPDGPRDIFLSLKMKEEVNLKISVENEGLGIVLYNSLDIEDYKIKQMEDGLRQILKDSQLELTEFKLLNYKKEDLFTEGARKNEKIDHKTSLDKRETYLEKGLNKENIIVLGKQIAKMLYTIGL